MAALSLSFLFPSPSFLAKVSPNNGDWHQKNKIKTALFSQIGLKWKDRACHLGAIGDSVQSGSTEDSGQAPQSSCAGAVLSHRAKGCFLAPSPSLSVARRDVRGLGSGYSHCRKCLQTAAAHHKAGEPPAETGRVNAARASRTGCSNKGTAFLRHILMHSSGNWT